MYAEFISVSLRRSAEPLRSCGAHRGPELPVVCDLTDEVTGTREEECTQFRAVQGVVLLELMAARIDTDDRILKIYRAVLIDGPTRLNAHCMIVGSYGEFE